MRLGRYISAERLLHCMLLLLDMMGWTSRTAGTPPTTESVLDSRETPRSRRRGQFANDG
jgi:hypothetical protein